MTKQPQPTRLLCVLVNDLRDAPPAQSRVDSCGVCGKAVWRALSSPKRLTAICGRCGLMELQAAGSGAAPAIAPPTKRQRADIRKYHSR